MKKIPARFVLATAATFVLVLSCYGLARAYLYYEAARAERMLKELAAVKIGDSEAQVLPMLERYGSCRGVLEPYTKVDKTDYECLVEIGPSGIYYVVNRANTSMFYRFCTTICKSAHSTRLSEKRRIRSLWRPRAAPSAADSSCLDNHGRDGAEL